MGGAEGKPPRRLPDVPTTATPIQCVTERVAHRNAFVTLYDDAVRLPDGTAGTYVRLVASAGHPGVAGLVLAGDRVGLVLVYRYPVGSWQWGIPRGFGDQADPRASLLRELDEELGGEPVSVEQLGVMHPDSGVLATEVHIFFAKWPEPLAVPRDEAEVQAVTWIAVADLREAIASGEITDGFTLAAVALADARGLLPS